jgi:hypothetical protein
MHYKFKRQAGDDRSTTLLAIIRTYHFEKLEFAERYEHKVFRTVFSTGGGGWLIENGEGLRHLASLLQVRTAVASFQHAERCISEFISIGNSAGKRINSAFNTSLLCSATLQTK